MVDIEVSGFDGGGGEPDSETAERLCRLAFAACGVSDGHAAVELVDDQRIRDLNRQYRARDAATDVLSFPVDGADSVSGPRELGDIFICAPLCSSVAEAVVHGALHLVGMDHETDSGEMLALQSEIMRWHQQ